MIGEEVLQLISFCKLMEVSLYSGLKLLPVASNLFSIDCHQPICHVVVLQGPRPRPFASPWGLWW